MCGYLSVPLTNLFINIIDSFRGSRLTEKCAFWLFCVCMAVTDHFSSVVMSKSFIIYFYPFCHPTMSAKTSCFRAVRPLRSSVRSSGQIFFTTISHERLSNLNETYSEYSIALLMT